MCAIRHGSYILKQDRTFWLHDFFKLQKQLPHRKSSELHLHTENAI